METTEKVLIKNYSLDKKEYELGRQIILDVTRSDLIELLQELPVVEHYLKIEIKSKKIDIGKIGLNRFTYSMYQKNFVLIKKENVELDTLLNLFDKYGFFCNPDYKQKTNLFKFKHEKDKTSKFGSNIIWTGIYPFSFIGFYSSLITTISLSIYENLYFLLIIAISLYSFIFPLAEAFMGLKKRRIKYTTPIIEEFLPYDASFHIVRLVVIVGMTYFLTFSLLTNIFFEILIILSLFIGVVNIPNLGLFLNEFYKHRRNKKNLMTFLNSFIQSKQEHSFNSSYISYAIIEIYNKKLLSFKHSNNIISLFSLILLVITPFFN